MKILHVQIFAGAMAVAFVGTGVAAMSIYSAKRAADGRAAKAEADFKTERARNAAIPASKKPLLGMDPEKEKRDLVHRVRTLEGRVKQLEGENDMLKKALAQATGQPQPKPVPGSGYGAGAAPPEIVVGNRDLAPPPPPEPGSQEPWGSSTDSEMEEMAAAVKLNPEQRKEVQKVILAAQHEYELALGAAEKAGTARTIDDVERIGMEVSQRTKTKIEQLLFPEQIELFRKFVEPREEPATPGEETPQQPAPRK